MMTMMIIVKGANASGRAGQHFDLFHSLETENNTTRVIIVCAVYSTAGTAACKVMPRVQYIDSQLKHTEYIIKIKIHSSCEIEDFVETHLCKLCVILRWRVLRVVCAH